MAAAHMAALWKSAFLSFSEMNYTKSFSDAPKILEPGFANQPNWQYLVNLDVLRLIRDLLSVIKKARRKVTLTCKPVYLQEGGISMCGNLVLKGIIPHGTMTDKRRESWDNERKELENGTTKFQDEWATSSFKVPGAYGRVENIALSYAYCDRKIKSYWTNGTKIEGRKSKLTEPDIPNTMRMLQNFTGKVDQLDPIDQTTAALQRQLGVYPHDSTATNAIEARGIYRLLGYEHKFQLEKPWDRMLRRDVSWGNNGHCRDDTDWRFFIDTQYDPKNANSVSPHKCPQILQPSTSFRQILKNTYKDTGRTGLAIEAAETMFHANTFYEPGSVRSPRANIFYEKAAEAGNTIMSLIVTVDAPASWIEFIIVCAVTSVHIILVAIVIVMFMSSKSFDNIGSSRSNA
ncbi:hypothetical protein FPQ18DRAFT_386121 [Pyronema domesticum]|nr:hypothetical protein FPQ18DRAFT_386121 [Pyronema domesticum]